jgi:hypothetical protein
VLKALRYIARRSWIGTESRRYCSELMSTFPASNIYGWTLASGARTRARAGCRRPSDGVWISSSVRESLPQRKRLWRGLSNVCTRAWWSIGRNCCHREGLSCCLAGGWWNALSPGSATTKDEQGLREVPMCKWRSVRICCDESPHAEAIGSYLRLFHTVSPGTRVNRRKNEGRSPMLQPSSYSVSTLGDIIDDSLDRGRGAP